MINNKLYVGKRVYIGSCDEDNVLVSDLCQITEVTKEHFIVHIKGSTEEEFARIELNSFDGVCYHWDEYEDLIGRVGDNYEEVCESLLNEYKKLV